MRAKKVSFKGLDVGSPNAFRRGLLRDISVKQRYSIKSRYKSRFGLDVEKSAFYRAMLAQNAVMRQ